MTKVFSLGASNPAATAAISAMKNQKGPVKKLQMNISEELHRSFKSACVSKGVDMTEVVEGFIIDFLSTKDDQE